MARRNRKEVRRVGRGLLSTDGEQFLRREIACSGSGSLRRSVGGRISAGSRLDLGRNRAGIWGCWSGSNREERRTGEGKGEVLFSAFLALFPSSPAVFPQQTRLEAIFYSTIAFIFGGQDLEDFNCM